jgi:hypothetical protein
VQIIATGYNHITGQQVVAQSATSGFTFALKATGETVTLQANAVNLAGKTQPGGPTHTVHLVATATVPCVVYDAVATSVANGNQITWPQNPEPTTTYKVTRTSAGLIATVPHGTEAEVNFLDVCASPATQTYTIVAHTAAGDAAASPTITPGQQFLAAAQGTGSTVSILTVANGANKSIVIATPTAGSNYFAVPLVTFTGSSLSHDATGAVNLDGAGHVASISIIDPGLYATADTPAATIHY